MSTRRVTATDFRVYLLVQVSNFKRYEDTNLVQRTEIKTMSILVSIVGPSYGTYVSLQLASRTDPKGGEMAVVSTRQRVRSRNVL